MDGKQIDRKEKVRHLVRDRISSMSVELRAEKSSKVISRLKDIEEFSKAGCIMTYVSKRDEVDTTGLIRDIIKLGKRVVVPRVDETRNELMPCEIANLKELDVGAFGVMEPDLKQIRPVATDDIDLIIVPGRAFDTRCNRLGRGKGYFDRFLKKIGRSKRIIGLAFSEQILENIPRDENDVKVDMVVTDTFVIRRGDDDDSERKTRGLK